jgi:hypothetical protein
MPSVLSSQPVGADEGPADGATLGTLVGPADGLSEGAMDGTVDGLSDGTVDGLPEGGTEGPVEGMLVEGMLVEFVPAEGAGVVTSALPARGNTGTSFGALVGSSVLEGISEAQNLGSILLP